VQVSQKDQVPKPAAAKSKGGDPDQKELFKMMVSADDMRLSHQDEAKRRGQPKKEKKLARARLGCIFLFHVPSRGGACQKERENPLFLFLFLFLAFLLEVPKGTLNLRKIEGKGKAS